MPNIIKKSIILAICAKHGNNEFRRLAHDLSRSDSKTLSLEHVANEFKTLETNLRMQNIQRDVTWHKSNGARQQAFAAPEEQMLDAAGKAVCRLYAKDGNCRYGVKCRYSHKQGVRSGKPVYDGARNKRDGRSTSRVRCYACKQLGHYKGDPSCKKTTPAKDGAYIAEESTDYIDYLNDCEKNDEGENALAAMLAEEQENMVPQDDFSESPASSTKELACDEAFGVSTDDEVAAAGQTNEDEKAAIDYTQYLQQHHYFDLDDYAETGAEDRSSSCGIGLTNPPFSSPEDPGEDEPSQGFSSCEEQALLCSENGMSFNKSREKKRHHKNKKFELERKRT